MSGTRTRGLLALLLLGLAGPVAARAQGAPSEGGAASDPERQKGWHRLVGILQYLEADYPGAVASGSEFELEEQQSFIAEAVQVNADLGPVSQSFAARLQSIKDRVDHAKDPQGVSRDCGALVEDLVLAGGLARSPRRPPDLKKGEQLWATACASCHGKDGKADVPLAATMEPKPANFHDPTRMGGLSPYKAFNTLSFGVTGTPMPAFPTLAEGDRWALAFYLFTLRQPTCDHKPPKVSLEKLATSTDAELAGQFGEKELACLRRTPPSADEEAALLVARGGVEDALRLSAQGNSAGARAAVLDAYLNGFEPVEPLLSTRNSELVLKIEQAFTRTRVAAENNSPHVQDEARELLTLIDQARRGRTVSGGFWEVFWLALLIIVREGFEATVVIAALLAVLKKMKQTHHSRTVHAGWISAIVAGALAFAFGHHALAGANRELLEGLGALAAVGMLIYAAMWLNARANIRKFMGELREKMQGALGQGSAAGLFAISFTAMFRESFETAVFLQGLAIDSGPGAAWGALGGVVVMLGLVFLINKVGYKLPMKPLFTASTWLLLGMSVVLLGKGLKALQEVGWIPLHPIPLFRFEFLGIFPDAFTFFPQLALASGIALWAVLRRRAEKPVPPANALPLV